MQLNSWINCLSNTCKSYICKFWCIWPYNNIFLGKFWEHKWKWYWTETAVPTKLCLIMLTMWILGICLLIIHLLAVNSVDWPDPTMNLEKKQEDRNTTFYVVKVKLNNKRLYICLSMCPVSLSLVSDNFQVLILCILRLPHIPKVKHKITSTYGTQFQFECLKVLMKLLEKAFLIIWLLFASQLFEFDISLYYSKTMERKFFRMWIKQMGNCWIINCRFNTNFLKT